MSDHYSWVNKSLKMDFKESKCYYLSEKRIMNCLACHSESFVSASLMASKGQASANPLDWMPDFQSRIQARELVDVLICQNWHCGQYHAVTNAPTNGKFSLTLRLIDLGFGFHDIVDERDGLCRKLTSSLETIIKPLRNLIVDYIHHTPGEFPRLSSSSCSSPSDTKCANKHQPLPNKDKYTTRITQKHQPFLDRDGCAAFVTHESYGKVRIVNVFKDESQEMRVFGYAYYPTSHFYNVVIPTWPGQL